LLKCLWNASAPFFVLGKSFGFPAYRDGLKFELGNMYDKKTESEKYNPSGGAIAIKFENAISISSGGKYGKRQTKKIFMLFTYL
jgi:hypothetical protein